MNNHGYNIDWIGKRSLFFAVSGTLFLGSLASILTKGFNYGIDFTGGTLVQISYDKERQLADVRADLDKAGYPDANVQSFGKGAYAIYLKGKGDQDASVVETFLKKFEQAAGPGLRVDRKEFVGPSVGRHLKKQAITAILLAVIGIIVYVAFRFENPLWGAAAVAAIAHDVTITAGIFSVFGIEVDLVIVAAFLTIAGYSINDTIVIFDRMRERMRTTRGYDLSTLINDSVNDMITRTILTNGMVLAVVLALFLLGGAVIHNFALAMLAGSILGTYSTVGVSMSLLHLWQGKSRSPHAPAKAKPVKK